MSSQFSKKSNPANHIQTHSHKAFEILTNIPSYKLKNVFSTIAAARVPITAYTQGKPGHASQTIKVGSHAKRLVDSALLTASGETNILTAALRF